MKVGDLQIGSWYEFTGYGKTVEYCRYLGTRPHKELSYPYERRYTFRFPDGWKYNYLPKDIRTMIKPCPKAFSDYLSLFILESSNEIT